MSNMEYYMIHYHIDEPNVQYIYITYLSPDEEIKLDNIGNKELVITRGDRQFSIGKNNVICYGHIDFNNSSDDMKTISNYNWFNNLEFKGKFIYTHYDYETHTCQSYNDLPFFSETWNPADIVKYAHGCINKPDSCLIFKHVNKL